MKFGIILQNEVKRLNLTDSQAIGTISNENDFRFMLLRHWNLYESMYYSNYVAAKFGVWWETGKK
jgi:cell division control protein 45